MDCFYAAIEMRDNPQLKNKPVAVGGSPQGRGVIATANYEARKFGVKSAMPSSQALRKCPHLVFVSPNFSKYKAESKKIRDIFHRYTDLVEPLSLDEAYLDVSHHPSATFCARQIREDIFSETELAASAGVAPNKFLAKVASDWNKPNGQFTITPAEISLFVEELPVERIFGVGKVTADKMHGRGLFTCGDLQKLSEPELIRLYGSWGTRLYNLSRGIDVREVKPNRERKSLSVESTYAEDLREFSQTVPKSQKLYQEFLQRWERCGLGEDTIKSKFIKLKFGDFQTTTREEATNHLPAQNEFIDLIEKSWIENEKPVRLIGLGVRIKAQREIELHRAQLSLFSKE